MNSTKKIEYFTSLYYNTQLKKHVDAIKDSINAEGLTAKERYQLARPFLLKVTALIDRATDTDKLNPFLSSVLYDCNRANISHYIKFIRYAIKKSNQRNEVLLYMIEEYTKDTLNAVGREF